MSTKPTNGNQSTELTRRKVSLSTTGSITLERTSQKLTWKAGSLKKTRLKTAPAKSVPTAKSTIKIRPQIARRIDQVRTRREQERSVRRANPVCTSVSSRKLQ